MGRFKKATREKIKLRMAIDGPSGAGKSYTALRFAFTLGKRVAVIDTESGSAAKYAGLAPDDIPFDFDVLELDTFSPTAYAEAIREAGAEGYDVIVVDSLSHAWEGKDGALDLVDRRGGKFTAWKDVTPLHRQMIESILRVPSHIIVTMRSKTEYVVEQDDKGRPTPRKVGMAPVQRPGMEYEFDVYGSMNWDHMLSITKSRCSELQDAQSVKPGASFVAPLIAWLNQGADPKPAPKPQLQSRSEPARQEQQHPASRPDDSKMGEDKAITKDMANYIKIVGLSKGFTPQQLSEKLGIEKWSELTVGEYRLALEDLETRKVAS